jgi:hypothetical protein
MRRFTRLTNAFSKKLENHRAGVGLHFAHYNFVRQHKTLRVNPAMRLGFLIGCVFRGTGRTDQHITMAPILESSFSHNGRHLTVRCVQQDNEFVVRVFEGEKHVGTATYRVTIETEFDGQMTGFDLRGLHGLMALAETDVVQGITSLLPPYSN